MRTKKLTVRQEKFVAEYLICLNATQAAKAAGYSAKTAYSSGPRMLDNVELSEIIDKKLKSALNGKHQVLKNKVVKELEAVGFSRLTRYFNDNEEIDIKQDDGSLKEYTTIITERGRSITQTQKIKLHDKNPSLSNLMKYLGMIKDDNRDLPSEITLRFLDARKPK